MFTFSENPINRGTKWGKKLFCTKKFRILSSSWWCEKMQAAGTSIFPSRKETIEMSPSLNWVFIKKNLKGKQIFPLLLKTASFSIYNTYTVSL